MIDRRHFLLSTVSLLAGIRVAPAADSLPAIDGAQSGIVPPDSIREIRDTLAPLIGAAQERYQCPGISLQLVTSERVLWSEGFGFADAEAKLRATPQTVYRAGSLAKPLTATAVMQLAEAGEVDIDQPLIGYLPELAIRSRFDAAGSPITVRSVLCHHSGLPTDLNKGMWSEDAFTGVAAALAEEYVAFPPDLVFAYSNIGYTLLGHMVEKVSGVPFADYLAANVLGPLGMERTSLW
jgi:CubicO group peptidase (beta-lactamase class C family)